MAAKTDISVMVVRQHLAELPRLPAVFAEDVAEVRGAMERKMRDAELLVDNAKAELEHLRNEYRREGSNVTWQDVRDAEDHVEDCKKYAEEVAEAAAKAKLRLRTLEDRFQKLCKAAFSRCEDALLKYQHFDAIPHSITAQTGGMAANTVARGTGMKSGISAAQGAVDGGKPLPALPAGMQWIAVDDLDWNQVPANLAFDKASQDEMAAMLTRFATEVLPLMHDPRGISRTQLEQLDRLAGRAGTPEGLVFTWECMIGGNEPITLNAPHPYTGPHYGWTFGRHRAMLARKLGWTHVPAKVI